MSNTYIIEVARHPVELCKLLKIADLVAGGGEAKVVISEGYVYVNGEVEFQKRKKIYQGDVIEFNGDFVELEVNEQLIEEQPQPQPKSKPAKEKPQAKKPKNKSDKKPNNNNKRSKAKAANQQPQNTPVITGKRKHISF